jgi:hypothetical protein
MKPIILHNSYRLFKKEQEKRMGGVYSTVWGWGSEGRGEMRR